MTKPAPWLTGVYPGSFDPVTLGHIDIAARALKVVDHLVIAVGANMAKAPLFSVQARVEMVTAELQDNAATKDKSWEVVPFDGLLVDFVQKNAAQVIVRGLRGVTDFEYESQMAGVNRRLNADVETLFFMAREEHKNTASRFVREVAALGGDVSSFVTPRVAALLKK